MDVIKQVFIKHIRILGTRKKITSQRCDVYFVSDKELRLAYSGLLVRLSDAV